VRSCADVRSATRFLPEDRLQLPATGAKVKDANLAVSLGGSIVDINECIGKGLWKGPARPEIGLPGFMRHHPVLAVILSRDRAVHP